MKYSDIILNKNIADSRNIVYKFTNVINNKIYIGITSLPFKKRIQSHISQSKLTTKSKKGYFQRALLAYGIDNFSVDILEYCNNNKELFAREIFWISFYKSSNPKFGYNSTLGGDGNRSGGNVPRTTRIKISKANKKLWSDVDYKKKIIQSRIQNNHKSTPIVQLDLSYNLINRFNSLREVILKYCKSINKLYKQDYVSSGMNIWMKESTYKNLELSDPVVVQLDNNNNIINYFYSFIEANRKIANLIGKPLYNSLKANLNSKSALSKGFKKCGYVWKLYNTISK